MNNTGQSFPARIVPGHQVASGSNGNPLFPVGTLKMQMPHFLALGLDLAPYHPGTLNVSIAPYQYEVLVPRLTLYAVKWHPTEPAEDFSFFDVRLVREGKPDIVGLVYYPHPETKPAHFQQSDTLELLLPFVPELSYGTDIRLEIPEEQMRILPPSTEQWRPSFHYTMRKGTLGDPNGLLLHDGKWRLHYQTGWPRSWGYASSNDLLHWEERPLALQALPNDSCWSGGAVFDPLNTSGLAAPGEACMVALYTSHNPDRQAKPGEQNIALAYSGDGGETWRRYDKNPALIGTTSNCRDPKVFWHEPTSRWIMLITEGRELGFYASPNLRDWNRLSTFQPPLPPGLDAFECPDIFPLPVENKPGKSKWVLTTSYLSGDNFIKPFGFGLCEQQYFVGEFDGVRFHPDAGIHTPKRLGAGPEEYAAITWPRQTEPARTLLIGWMGHWGFAGKRPTHPWKEQMTLPREITLHQTGPQDWQLRQAPAREFWNQPHTLETSTLKMLESHEGRHVLGKARCAALRSVIKPAKNSVIEFELFASDHIRTQIGYDSARETLYFDRRNSGSPDFHPRFLSRYDTPLPLSADGRITLDIIVDHSSVEVFANDGTVYMSGTVFPDSNADELAVMAVAGSAAVEFLELRILTAMI